MYGRATKDEIKANEAFASGLGVALVQISFLMFGALVVGTVFERVTWQVIVMAVLALTVVRIVPVAISMIGAAMAPPTVLYLGWFGPRGLATVVFAVLVIQDADLPATGTIITVAGMTVLLSVLAHGATAYFGSQRYADWYHDHEDTAGLAEAEPLDKPHLRAGRYRRPRVAPPQHDQRPSQPSEE
jgi:NhaP-type Na+/H+ or K+/H+ antiporter